MNSTLTLRQATINARLWFCALLAVYAIVVANLCWLGSEVTHDGALKRAFFAVKPKNNLVYRVHLVQNSIVKTAKSDQVHYALGALALWLTICCYLHFYLSVPPAVRYRLATYLKRFFEKLTRKRHAAALAQDPRSLGDLLVACKVITAQELEEAGQGDQASVETLVRLGQITDNQLQSALAIQAKLQKRASRKEKALAWLSAGDRDHDRAAQAGAILRLRTHL